MTNNVIQFPKNPRRSTGVPAPVKKITRVSRRRLSYHLECQEIGLPDAYEILEVVRLYGSDFYAFVAESLRGRATVKGLLYSQGRTPQRGERGIRLTRVSVEGNSFFRLH